VPELPEVETTRLGVTPHLLRRCIRRVVVRRRDLRHPVPDGLESIAGRSFTKVDRRGKYLVLWLDDGRWLLVHLGMSGSLRMVGYDADWKKHDHIAVELEGGMALRYHDPRRFGLWLMGDGDVRQHPLLSHLGPEPLGKSFTAEVLGQTCRGSKVAIKQCIMDATVVVGVGNIYASEALFRAKLHPTLPAGDLSGVEIGRLVRSIRKVLREAIAQGGTTLRDFVHSDGSPGYFRQRLMVYERAGKPCRVCGTAIQQQVIGQRSTYWCPRCQPIRVGAVL
jgi:formamidopyrimidine-DNA glycosylase